MATCSFIKERKQTAGSMGRVIQYVSQPKKTMDEEGNRYLTGVNCVADVAMQSFMATKHLYGKDTGTFFYQYTQSFSPEEDLTPAQAHEIGLKLAERFFPGCEVLVATHVDRQHLHSHLVVNSVHPDTGKKLHFTPRTLEEMRKVSDQICMEHGLTTLKPYQQDHRTKGLRAGEYRAAMRGESWKFRLITTVEAAMRRAGSREEFIQEMNRRGYQVRWKENRKCSTYTTPTGMKCRDDRLHSERYRKEVMELELRTRTEIIHGRTEAAESIPVFFAADADYTSAGANTTGLEGTADCNGPIRAPSFGPDSRFAGAFHPDGCLPHPAPDRGPVAGCGPDTDAAATGWEEERAAFLCAQVGAAANPLAQPDSRTGSVPGSWRYALGSMVHLGKALEPAPSDFPVKDSTVKPRHTDRKLWQTQRRKKIALGHKPDDQENESVWQHSL